MANLTQEKLKELLSYDKETGIFKWRKRVAQRVRVGDIAGSVHEGYCRISIKGKRYLAHRLAWLYEYGGWPEFEIDHINRARNDNRIENLREAMDFEQQQNRSLDSRNTSGYTGVSWDGRRGKWQASIRHHGKLRYIGRFDDVKDAAAAYSRAKSQLHTFNPKVKIASCEAGA